MSKRPAPPDSTSAAMECLLGATEHLQKRLKLEARESDAMQLGEDILALERAKTALGHEIQLLRDAADDSLAEIRERKRLQVVGVIEAGITSLRDWAAKNLDWARVNALASVNALFRHVFTYDNLWRILVLRDYYMPGTSFDVLRMRIASVARAPNATRPRTAPLGVLYEPLPNGHAKLVYEFLWRNAHALAYRRGFSSFWRRDFSFPPLPSTNIANLNHVRDTVVYGASDNIVILDIHDEVAIQLARIDAPPNIGSIRNVYACIENNRRAVIAAVYQNERMSTLVFWKCANYKLTKWTLEGLSSIDRNLWFEGDDDVDEDDEDDEDWWARASAGVFLSADTFLIRRVQPTLFTRTKTAPPHMRWTGRQLLSPAIGTVVAGPIGLALSRTSVLFAELDGSVGILRDKSRIGEPAFSEIYSESIPKLLRANRSEATDIGVVGTNVFMALVRTVPNAVDDPDGDEVPLDLCVFEVGTNGGISAKHILERNVPRHVKIAGSFVLDATETPLGSTILSIGIPMRDAAAKWTLDKRVVTTDQPYEEVVKSYTVDSPLSDRAILTTSMINLQLRDRQFIVVTRDRDRLYTSVVPARNNIGASVWMSLDTDGRRRVEVYDAATPHHRPRRLAVALRVCNDGTNAYLVERSNFSPSAVCTLYSGVLGIAQEETTSLVRAAHLDDSEAPSWLIYDYPFPPNSTISLGALDGTTALAVACAPARGSEAAENTRGGSSLVIAVRPAVTGAAPLNIAARVEFAGLLSDAFADTRCALLKNIDAPERVYIVSLHFPKLQIDIEHNIATLIGGGAMLNGEVVLNVLASDGRIVAALVGPSTATILADEALVEAAEVAEDPDPWREAIRIRDGRTFFIWILHFSESFEQVVETQFVYLTDFGQTTEELRTLMPEMIRVATNRFFVGRTWVVAPDTFRGRWIATRIAKTPPWQFKKTIAVSPDMSFVASSKTMWSLSVESWTGPKLVSTCVAGVAGAAPRCRACQMVQRQLLG